jgi:8-oxo-dGTP pyrophosphatase MutT (NUDIX family)
LSRFSAVVYYSGMQDRLRQLFAIRERKEIKDDSKIDAAVLVPIFCKDKEYHVLLTKRSFDVQHHRGQIAFPGGSHSEADKNLLDTALRESKEEIGLNPRDARVIGELDDIVTITNFKVTPYVAIIPHPYEFTRNPNEILEIFDVPVSALLKKMNFKEEVRTGHRGQVTVYFYKYKGKVIWGTTAAILKQLLDTMKSACKSS